MEPRKSSMIFILFRMIFVSIQITWVTSSSSNVKIQYDYTKYNSKKHFGIIPNKCNKKRKKIEDTDDNHCYNNKALNVRGGSDESNIVSSIIAGSIAGAVGVGIAFPLDKLKTKSQVLSTSTNGNHNKRYHHFSAINTNGGAAVTVMAPSKMNNIQLVRYIWSTEGIKGFFGGVRAAMIGQALIKAIAFTSNTNILKYLRTRSNNTSVNDDFSSLLLAACISGIITSFVVVPVERIKIIMQAQESGDDGGTNKNYYKNEFDCLRMVLQTEGWIGLCTRGLGTTIIREIPSYAIYFVLYGYTKTTKLAKFLGPLAPIVLGALSGCASWIPIYPIDVIKTLLQNTSGSNDDNVNILQMIHTLHKNGGIGIFFDGLQPKLMESAVKHAIVFWLYNLIMSFLASA